MTDNGDNNETIRSVSQLLRKNYYIPAYQRGYRWTKQQVIDLLDDIATFIPKDIDNSDEKTWYCIQPIVARKVKIKNDDGTKHKESFFELIDGQQRLTTIFLINHYLNERVNALDPEPEPTIKYQTRENSTEFLRGLSVGNDGNLIHKENMDFEKNIDFSHMWQAYSCIHNWYTEKRESADFDKGQFISKFYHSTKAIWYEPVVHGDGLDDSIAIFTRLNIGKIPLTDAELIKAMFIKQSNFSSSELSEDDKREQFKIGLEWDRIENDLHDAAFWSFLTPVSYTPETRIDLLFELLTDMPNENESYSIFRMFENEYKMTSPEEVHSTWRKVTETFETLIEWYQSRELYHKIGFLIEAGTTIKDIFKRAQGKKKSAFINELNSLISSHIPKNFDAFDELDYNKDRKHIKNVLLLHNIQTLLNNIEETSRFPFERYKGNKKGWDVEHIHSRTDPDAFPGGVENQREWLEESLVYVDEELNAKIEAIKDDPELDEKTFLDHAKEVLNQLAGTEKDDDSTKDKLGNLALLDASTNRSYGNAIFPVKRSQIVEREKTGTFVPVCTKNVFMKLYTENVNNLKFWGIEDRDKYMKDIKETLKIYITGGKTHG
ncbi:MAG: hypothetical protein B0D92_02915 [Spirochaeta sp. LUC14_002_19_P3]|nr:MAG: hypothetical protein B0D92_02915 [Spirochaeta sp. LUC14_002_19_P3]